MDLKLTLRILLGMQLLLLLAALVLDSFLTAHLPEQLQLYLSYEINRPVSELEGILFMFLPPFLLLYLISMMGIFYFKKWAKDLYLGSSLILLLVTAFTGPTVEHAIVTVISSLGTLCVGFIFALLLISNVIPKR